MRIVIAAALLCFSQAYGQGAPAKSDYPTKPIRIIVPFPPGGINDFAARSVSGELADQLKVPVTVDNRPGAGGIVGTQLAATASADGYSLETAQDRLMRSF